VLDRGPGIAPDQLAAVFEPFHRLDASRSPATGGSGLGLAIVRELARANGWQVALEARPGGGVQAWIELSNQVAGKLL
jgi:two-component system osmolarity sensor histidine kinase EnvZ